MKLVETQFSARLRLGDVGDVIGELEAAVATYPFQEGLWELLITALYRAGRQADALATYQRVRNQLADELGLDPGPQLQQLEQQILDPRRVARRPDARPRPVDGRREPAVDVGRARRTRAEIAAAGRPARARAARRDRRARRHREDGGRDRDRPNAGVDGVAPAASGWPGSRAATTADEVVDTVIAALNVTGGEAALFERLKGAAAVVILDNCEHVVDAAAALAVRLLDAAPGLRILCTSQVPLDVDGEAVFELAPLALADAVELFTRRAARAASTGGASRRRGAASCAVRSTVCRWRSSSPRRGPRRCRSRRSPAASTTASTCCATRPAAGPSAAERSGRRSGGATSCCSPTTSAGCGRSPRSPAAHRCRRSSSSSRRSTCPASAAIDVVGRLASRSLVIVDDDGVAPVRYRLLDSIRAFALEAMADAGLTERALAAHAAWFADAAGSSTARRAQQPPGRAPRLRPGRARQHRRRAGLERRARPAARARHRQRVRLGLGRPRRQPRRATDPGRARRRRRRGPEPRPSRRPAARGVDRGVDRSPRARPRAHRRGHRRSPTRSTTSTCRRAAATTSPTSCRTTASSGRRWS